MNRGSRALKRRFYNGIRKIYPQFGYDKSDIYISSYPKSGRNWIHFLIANTFATYSSRNEIINFHTISKWISEDFPKKSPVPDVSLPRIVAQHKLYGGQNVRTIYIMRHPADVMVSYYHYNVGRKKMELESLSSMIRNTELGVPAWVRHVESWQNNWELLVKYEDLKRDALNELSRIIRFIGVDSKISGKILEKAVEKSSFESMREIEKKWGLPKKPGKNPNFTFMREGKSTEGKEMFSPSDYSYLKEKAGYLLDRYGYGLEAS